MAKDVCTSEYSLNYVIKKQFLEVDNLKNFYPSCDFLYLITPRNAAFRSFSDALSLGFSYSLPIAIFHSRNNQQLVFEWRQINNSSASIQNGKYC